MVLKRVSRPKSFSIARRRIWLALALSISGAAHAQAQADAPQAIHWAYSTFFGTGAYETSSGAEATVVSVRPGRRFRTAALDDTGKRTVGIRLRVPVAVGVHDFEDTSSGAALDFHSVGTLSVTPGVEIDIPLTARWSLKPLVYGGWGTELHGDASAWIYWAGVKSRLRFGSPDFEWALVNTLTYVGYSADGGERSSLRPILTAMEFSQPIAKKLGGEPVRLHWHVAYTDYLNEAEFKFRRRSTPPLEVAEEWELGVAFSTGERPLRLWRLRWDRLGLAYRFSNDGELRGIGLVFSSLFDR